MLRIRELVKVYPGPVTALQGVNLEIPDGMFGLLGPNGAGKTTLMRILAGQLEATSGSVTLDGDDILESPERVWSQLGYLPQEFGFYPHLTGEAMLRYLLQLKGVENGADLNSVAAALLDRVHLGYAARRKLKGYSGGMRQRLGIAQAIAGNPRLIIVDEPTAGLDPEERLNFYHLLAELAQDRTVVLSTHIVEDVAVLCPNFAVIRRGKLLATTTPAEARAPLQGRIFEGHVEAAGLQALANEVRVVQALLVEGRHRVRLLVEDGPPPPGFQPAEPTLEDAYLVMVGDDKAAEARGLEAPEVAS